MKKTHSTKQGELVVKAYYSKVLWHDVDLYQHNEIESPKDSTKLTNLFGRYMTFEFLTNLNMKLDEVRS